jgi:membrane-bound lytic murein transglycosylase B
MMHLLLLFLLAMLGSSPRAESDVSVKAKVAPLDVKHSGRNYNYAQRDEVQAFVLEMHERHGFDVADLDALFRQIKPVAAVLKAIMPPKDPGVRSWQAYRARFIEPKRIAAGRRFMLTYATELADAETRFGVPASVVAAVIGIETIYGRQLGRFGTFAALATLAFDYPPRAALFRRELEELLLLAREERRSPLAYTGSYAGALGLPQFLPSSRRRFAIDFDHDGRIDLAKSPADAVGSVANFLQEHGWERDAPIAIVVAASGQGVQALIDEGISPLRTPRQMKETNVTFAEPRLEETAPENPVALWTIPERPAALIDLVTPQAATEYRLGYRNFYVITRYNRSSFYAAAVIDLAAALRASQ